MAVFDQLFAMHSAVGRYIGRLHFLTYMQSFVKTFAEPKLRCKSMLLSKSEVISKVWSK